MRVLGIETSCDETAAAVVSRARDGSPAILSNTIASQFAIHAAYGGVVPELAARAHLTTLDAIIVAALQQAGIGLADIDAVAVTTGPGLAGGLLVGMMTAKAIAASRDLPFLAINHLEGHALTARLTDRIEYPYLLLLVSGGHTQLLLVRGLGQYQRWASTIDDALGEAFDKTAKLLGLGHPGGPAVERAASGGNGSRFDLPRPLHGQPTLNFSFSGLKTAIRQQAEQLQPLGDRDIADLCASFQASVCDTLADRCERAILQFSSLYPDIGQPVLVVAGGVAANRSIRAVLAQTCARHDWRLVAPPLELCGDNAAMIAWAGLERIEAGLLGSLDVPARPRWPLDDAAPAVFGSGKKGAKA
jgi:N6-L-threonylcarbamoyladenine synthase